MSALAAVERIEPGMIGDASRRLYACRHVPDTPLHPVRLVVLCHPLMHEYERCHRMYRALAAALARAGAHALRFDYRGAGDSSGEPEAIDFEALCADASAAIDHAVRLTGAASIGLMGARVGANVAARVAAAREDVSDVVLWSAVTDGPALAREWLALQNDFEAGMGHAQSAMPPPEILGEPLSAGLAGWLLHTPLACPFEDARGGVRRVLWIGEAQGADWPTRMAAGGIEVTRLENETAAPWRQEPSEAPVAAALVKEMVEWLTSQRR